MPPLWNAKFLLTVTVPRAASDFLSIKNWPFLVSQVQHPKDTVGKVRRRTRCLNYLISIDINGSKVAKEGMMCLFATT